MKENKEELLKIDLKSIPDQILIDTHGYNMIINDFYLLISDFKNIAFVIKISSSQQTDQYGQIGWELPKITENDLLNNPIHIAKQYDRFYSFNKVFLNRWNGEAAYFNYMD